MVSGHDRIFGHPQALRVEGLDAVIEQRNPQGTPWDPDCDEAPVLLVMSDNGPQMSSGTTREFMALCWLATLWVPKTRPWSLTCRDAGRC